MTQKPLTNETRANKALVSREPWPSAGIDNYRSIDDGKWGYLLLFDDGHFEFDGTVTPERAEILQRWSAYLVDETGSEQIVERV